MTTVKKSNVVAMKDGREVDFGQRGKLKKQANVSGEGAERKATITVDCINGDTHEFSFDASHPLFWEFAMHGVSQKITDSITKAEDLEDVSFGVQNQIERLVRGDWSQRSSDGSVRGFSDLLEALRRIKGFELESAELAALKKVLSERSEENIKLMKANNGVKAVLATILSEKAAAKAEKLMKESGDEVDDLGI